MMLGDLRGAAHTLRSAGAMEEGSQEVMAHQIKCQVLSGQPEPQPQPEPEPEPGGAKGGGSATLVDLRPLSPAEASAGGHFEAVVGALSAPWDKSSGTMPLGPNPNPQP